MSNPLVKFGLYKTQFQLGKDQCLECSEELEKQENHDDNPQTLS